VQEGVRDRGREGPGPSLGPVEGREGGGLSLTKWAWSRVSCVLREK
jgi:hypothetical protein